MKKVTRYVVATLFAIFVASPVLAVVSPVQPTAEARNCEARFLGVPPWYRGLMENPEVAEGADCNLKSPASFESAPGKKDGLSVYIWKIVLNAIEMALVVAAYLAIFFVIYGGFQFITGGASSDTVAKARNTILNAVIGLIISLGAIAITNYIFGIFAGSAGDATIGGKGTGIQQLTGEQLLNSVLNIVYFIIGTVSVIVVIISGLMYTISSGDSGRVSRAKNMLVFAIVGLIIAISAYAITNFIMGRFS